MFNPIRSLLFAACIAATGTATAQQSRILPDSALIAVKPERLGLVGIKSLRGAEKFIVPTVLLYLSIDGTARAADHSVRVSSAVSGEYRVLGLQAPFVQDLARSVQSDLAARFRSTGASLLLYEEVQSNPLLSAVQRLPVDTSYGVPTAFRRMPRTTYAIIAPSDAQRFAGAELKKHQAFKNLARETGAVVIVAELWFQSPQFERLLSPPEEIAAKMIMSPGMDLWQAALTFITPSGATGSITHMTPIVGVGRGIGDLIQTGADTAQFSNSMVRRLLGSGIGKSLGSNVFATTTLNFVVSEGPYSDGVLRGAMSFLSAAIAVIERERRK